MEKNRQVLVDKANFNTFIKDIVQDKNKEFTYKKNSLNFGTCLEDEMEKQTKILNSNYKSFLLKWHKNSEYPLPSAFSLIRISNHSQKIENKQYQLFNFPILSYTCKQLCQIAVKIIATHQFESFCSKKQISKFVQQICLQYNIVSYHNFSHGFSLMHMLYQLTKLDIHFKKMFTAEQFGYTFLAALGHDLGHQGTNNVYQIKMKTTLAEWSNNQSVLQKMHIKRFFDIIREKNLKIFQKSSKPQRMKQLVTMNILSTDFSQHFKNMERLKSLSNQQKINCTKDHRKYFYLGQIFHACDIGNPALQFQQYINWSALLTYQFNSQTIKQEKNKIEVTQFLKYKTEREFYKGQIGFINNFVFPIWKQLSSLWPGFNFLVENVQRNASILKIKAQNQNNDS